MRAKKPTQAKVSRRKWATISQEVCAANNIPPGFRISVLLDDRVLRDDMFVMADGQHICKWPSDFRVWAFLQCLMDEEILRLNPDFAFDKIILRDNRNRTVDPDMHLYEVQDMKGKPNRAFDRRRLERKESITDIAGDIEAAVEDIAFNWDHLGQDAQILLPFALLEFAFAEFDPDLLEYVLSQYASPGFKFRVNDKFRKKTDG